MSSQNADSLQPNVYRDGRCLVVPLEGAIFPKRCVKTNRPVDDADFAFEADLLRSQLQVPKSAGEQAADVAAGAIGGRAGRAAVELINKRRLKFNIGLSDERRTRAQQRWRYGLGLAIGGPISDWLGVQVWFIIGGAICVLASVVMLLTPAVMNLESHGHAVQAARDAESDPSASRAKR